MNMDQKKIAKIYQNRETIKALEKETKELIAELGDLAVDNYAVGPFKVAVTPNRRFSAKKAEAMLTKSQFQRASKRVADSALVKALYPDLYPEMQDEYAPKVAVTIPND